jgi:hypothetical protein
MNQLLALDASGRVYVAAHEYLKNFKIYRNAVPSPEIFEIMRGLVTELTSGQTISLPFVGKTLSFGADSGNLLEVAKALDSIKTLKASSAGARQAAKAYAEEMDRMLQVPRGEGPPPPEDTRLGIGATAVAELLGPASAATSVAPPSSRSSVAAGASNAAAAAAVPTIVSGAFGGSQRDSSTGRVILYNRANTFTDMSAPFIKDELRVLGLPTSGNKRVTYDRLIAEYTRLRDVGLAVTSF